MQILAVTRTWCARLAVFVICGFCVVTASAAADGGASDSAPSQAADGGASSLPAPLVADAGLPLAAPVPPPPPHAEEPQQPLFAPKASGAPMALVTYHEEEAFSLPAAGGRDAKTRAREATAALTAAIEAKKPGEVDAPVAQVLLTDGVALVRVRGYVITALYPSDAHEAGFPDLKSFGAHIEARLMEFVPAQLRRSSLQETALHIFLSVFIGLLGFVALRQLRVAFNRAEEALQNRREALQAVTILRVPVLSGEAVGGALAFSIAIGRVLAYLLTIGASLAAIAGQFPRTRPLLTRLATASGGLMLEGLQGVGKAVPSVLLALVLVVGLHAALRVLNVLLDGVRSKRLTWSSLPPRRVPVFRIFVTAAVLMVMAPLISAAAFGRFDTPLEQLALYASGVLLVGLVPSVANWVVGGTVLWRASLEAGDWIRVGAVSGEVTTVNFSEVVLVPEQGGSIAVPMMYLLLHPVHRLRGAPTVHVRVTLTKDRPAREMLAAVRKLVKVVEANAHVEFVSVSETTVELDIAAPALRPSVREDLWLAVDDAAGRAELKLVTSGKGPEPAP